MLLLIYGLFQKGRVLAQDGMPRSRVETWIQALGRTWTTENVLAGYATVALASILDPSGGLFSDAARPGQCPFSYWAQTWHSKIAIRDESQK